MENFEIFKQLRNKSKEYYTLWNKSHETTKFFVENLNFDEICEIILTIMKTNDFMDYSNKDEFIYFLDKNSDCFSLVTYGNCDYDSIYDYVIKNIKSLDNI